MKTKLESSVMSRRLWLGMLMSLSAIATVALFACAGETVIQTVEVPVERQVEVRVVETVVVEKQVQVAGETIIQEVEVPVERVVEVKVVETVVVERERVVEGRTVVRPSSSNAKS